MPFLEYKEHQVYYHQYGDGDKVLIALHGFADNGDLFKDIALKVWSNDYTTLAIDLPFHGQKTSWKGDIYKPEDIAHIVLLLLQQFKVESCTMACHSMGGRIIWGILPLLAKQIEEIYFFAPAGFQYTFTASRLWCPMWFRKRARNHFETSEGILRFFEVTHRLKLMNRATYLVFKQQLDLPRRRARMLKTWMAMYYFPMKASMAHLKLLNQYQVKTYFFYGKKDRITPATHAQKFLKQLDETELLVFKGNHFFVREKLAQPLKSWYERTQQGRLQ
ncbi:alpha/beta fold hydrolase [Aureispira sp. CCB-QB1]|uniref:alpha/beta fold hydrolase n=1 Tax=Aureispira sp. CCB-QB1 TaxID=1313421 RepID=UPI0006985901|nr:alpha/beta hydrolase [Aureispira sp. CCB-QB1]